jgi:hypothetical protein
MQPKERNDSTLGIYNISLSLLLTWKLEMGLLKEDRKC